MAAKAKGAATGVAHLLAADTHVLGPHLVGATPARGVLLVARLVARHHHVGGPAVHLVAPCLAGGTTKAAVGTYMDTLASA